MRTTDERLAAVESRVRELEQQKRQRRYHYVSFAAVAACLAFIVGLGFSMPGIMEGLTAQEYNNSGFMASIFHERKALGYVLVGILAFALGVCLTILCYMLQPERQRNKEDHKNDRDH